MGDTHDNGGPAFPRTWNYSKTQSTEYDSTSQDGMTLRDYFAAKSIQAMLAPCPVTGKFPQVSDFEACATTAYKMADAMLAARSAIPKATGEQA